MDLAQIMETDEKFYMNTFGKRTPAAFTRGEGMYLYDTTGKRYTDFMAGIAVNCLGYGHPAFCAALKEQIDKVIHTSSLYYIEPQALLAKALVEKSCANRVFFANSGAEANEGAIKLAKIYFYKKGVDKSEIITLKSSFHGRTLATVAATGQEKYQKPYKPLAPGFSHVAINDFEALSAAVNEKTAAIMLELVQGESGVHPVEKSYLEKVRALCDEKGILLIFDEIQTGIGRTGKLFCYENYGVTPDIFTLAKALGGGVPIGAVCATDEVAAAFTPGDHGTTFGGNPLATAAGLSVLSILEKERLIENAAAMGAYLKDAVLALGSPYITEVRGLGLMVGVGVTKNAAALRQKLFGKGFLVGNVGEDTLRLVPPLIIEKQHIDAFCGALLESLNEI